MASLSTKGDIAEFWLYPEDKEIQEINDEWGNQKLKFETLVRQLIKCVMLDSNAVNDIESWVDVVATLSNDAARYVKSGADVKIKCVATGSRLESEIVNGCVFKTDKHMPTRKQCDFPTLMLIRGSLDLPSGELSSLEDDILKSTVGRIQIYKPAIILVEKSVSRGIQDVILSKGITLVFDHIKLDHLERIARCTGSAIMSPDLPSGHELGHCRSFHIDEYPEEHNVLAEDCKKPSKTLMFFEGCPSDVECSVNSAYGSHCCHSKLDFIESLKRSKNWDATGGKSKAFFAKTLDDRFIIKGIKRIEYDSFQNFGPEYFNYMKDCDQTCLAKILGIYQVIDIRATRHDLVVMENLSYGRNFTKQYDLKGALHARFSCGSGETLLDQNLINDMKESPLYISPRSIRNLGRAVWSDTSFLKSINVMDYSLLVGVDTERRQLVCGIIDYLGQYTWDKQFESFVKSCIIPKDHRPTVIAPAEYEKRFRNFITNHFMWRPRPRPRDFQKM